MIEIANADDDDFVMMIKIDCDEINIKDKWNVDRINIEIFLIKLDDWRNWSKWLRWSETMWWKNVQTNEN
jgi:hypothetical protein